MEIHRKPTRTIRIGNLQLGHQHPIRVQTMTSTRTQDVRATVEQIHSFEEAGAEIVRIAVDSIRDVHALASIRKETSVALVVDLQENYRLAKDVAPFVDKLRYNPGHLYHHEKHKSIKDKVRFLSSVAQDYGLALRIGVNCGSVDPQLQQRYPDNPIQAMLESAFMHCEMLEHEGFTNFLVSLKDSDPLRVVEVNRRFADIRSDIPIHLGVTEAGMPPQGILKTRLAFEPLLAEGIGDTLRVSLTLPSVRKFEEILVGRKILEDIAQGRFMNPPVSILTGVNIISCPSCSRVENERFVDLAEQVRDLTKDLDGIDITIAVMGCRVNGPGETDDADLGLWCGPTHVTLKRGKENLGFFRYDEILPRLKQEIEKFCIDRIHNHAQS